LIATVSLSFQKNKIKIGCYLGNSDCDGISGASSKVNVLNTQIGFTQIIDKSSLVKMALFYINEHGYLINPYMRIGITITKKQAEFLI